MRIPKFILLAVGVIGILISLPLLLFSGLGFFGVLADVGPAENRGLGMKFLCLGLPPLIGGVLLCAFGLNAFARDHHREDAADDGTCR